MRGDRYSYLKRRRLLAAAFGAGSFALSSSARAAAPAGIPVLDNAAIKAKHPDSVFLVAITRAANRIIAVGEEGVIIYSDDDGNTWRQASVPVRANLTCVAFSTSRQGWAAGHFGVILNSTDGGETWNLQLTGAQANALALTAAEDPALRSSHVPAAALAEKRAQVFLQQGPSKPFLTLLAVGAERVIVFGADRMAVLTTNGGKDWVDWSLHIGDRFSHNLYSAAQTGTGIYIVGETGLVFCSTDDGASFPAVSSPAEATLFGVLGTIEGSVLVFGVIGNCFRSTDHGQSWNQITLDTQDTLTAGRVLSSGAILLSTEAGAVFVSQDDGRTFKAVAGIPPMAIFDLQEAADKSIIFVGSTGLARVKTLPFHY